MNSWIFQANPDAFDIDGYLSENTQVVWLVRQKHLAKHMQVGDEVFFWRASGSTKAVAGVVAQAVLLGEPTMMPDDPAAKKYWKTATPGENELRVGLRVTLLRLGSKETIRRDWLKQDPVLHELRILKLASETNYRLASNEAERLAALVRNTGRDWTAPESTAGLWAYAQTYGKGVSRRPGSAVAEVALTIGRATSGVYNKVMNFRAIDPRDSRKGLTGGSEVDRSVWAQFFDPASGQLRQADLDSAYTRLWGRSPSEREELVYSGFGDAPNDDPVALQHFAAKVRKGQPAFRKNLRKAYGDKCTISGHGPEHVLEAVHIVPHAESGINALDNGLLLRADLHSLLDAGWLTIDPSSFSVCIDSKLKDTPYWNLHGATLRRREDGKQMGRKYLKQRYDKT